MKSCDFVLTCYLSISWKIKFFCPEVNYVFFSPRSSAARPDITFLHEDRSDEGKNRIWARSGATRRKTT